MKYLICSVLLCCAAVANAQDTIYKMKAAPIIVKLEEINPGKVKYKLWDYQSGPSYVMPRRDIEKIVSSDGKVLWINEKAWEQYNDGKEKHETVYNTSSPRIYPPNILVISPVCVMANGFGAAASYEHVNKKGNTGVRVILAGTADNPAGYIMPSLRLYPFGQRIGSFFVAPSLFAGYGSHPYTADSLNKYGEKISYMDRRNEFQWGFFAETGVNLHILTNMVAMTSVGIGVNYAALGSQQLKDYAVFAKFEVGFGYRF